MELPAHRMNLPEIGQAAPDAAFHDREGKPIHFSDFWHAHTTVFIFLRHFG
jgi:hypothetical protein